MQTWHQKSPPVDREDASRCPPHMQGTPNSSRCRHIGMDTLLCVAHGVVTGCGDRPIFPPPFFCCSKIAPWTRLGLEIFVSLSLSFSLSLTKKKKKTWRDRTGAGRQYKPAAEETKLKMKAEKGGRLAPSPKRLTHIAPGMWSTSANNPADVCGERLCGTGRWHP